MSAVFPSLNSIDWQSTRDTLHSFSRVLGKVRQALTPPHPHWWHASLRVDETGLTTTPIPAANDTSFILQLDLKSHALVFTPPAGTVETLPLVGQNSRAFLAWILDRLDSFNIHPEVDKTLFDSPETLPYTPAHAETLFAALDAVNQTFVNFRDSLSGEASPVQLWPHHFDLSVVWFSGREAATAPGEESGLEQVGYGFSTGDGSVPEPYFYANPWPVPEGIFDTALPAGTQWFTESWRGGLLHYHTVAAAPQPAQQLMEFLHAVQHHSKKFMQA